MTPDHDQRIAALLDVHTPPLRISPDWAAVLTTVKRQRTLRRTVRVLALLAAAVAVTVPVALAKSGVFGVTELFGPATPHQRHQVERFNRTSHLKAAIGTTIGPLLQLVTLRASGSTFTYVAARIPGKAGCCVYQLETRRRLHWTDFQCGWSPSRRRPAVSATADGEGPGAALDALAWVPSMGSKEWPRVSAWVVVGDLPPGAETVEARFQDGSTAPAHTTGRFFSYVVAGTHVTAGHRPVAFLGLNRDGVAIHRQRFDPRTFDMQFIRLVRANPQCHFELWHRRPCKTLRDAGGP